MLRRPEVHTMYIQFNVRCAYNTGERQNTKGYIFFDRDVL